MNEQNLVKIVAKIAPWLAPLPSAYFVARASVRHLAVMRPVDVIIALIIETLGVSSIHTFLWLFDWNETGTTDKGNARKGIVLAPALEIWGAMGISLLYLIITISLTVVLEVYPDLSIYAPALFPVLSVVGAVNLVLIARQESRETIFTESKNSVKPSVKSVKPEVIQSDNGHNTLKEARKEVLRAILQSNPDITPTEAAKALGVSRPTVYSYLRELE